MAETVSWLDRISCNSGEEEYRQNLYLKNLPLLIVSLVLVFE